MLDSFIPRMRATSDVERFRPIPPALLARRRASARGLLLALRARRLAGALPGGGFRGVALGEAALQRLDEVDDLLARLGARRRHHLLAGDLALDRLEQGAAVLVLVALRLEVLPGELLDELLREGDLAGLQRHVLAELDLVESAHLVRVVEAVEGEPAQVRAHEHELPAPSA